MKGKYHFDPYHVLLAIATNTPVRLKTLNKKRNDNLKNCDGFACYKHAASQFTRLCELCELLVDYCDVFISCLDSHSDGTHSLQRIHWCTSDVMLNY